MWYIYHMDFGKRFKHYRQEAGLTQKEAAVIIGVNDYQLGNYETNRSEPSLDVLKKMSQTYHVSIDRLLNNNWMKKETEPILDEDGYVDVDKLVEQLNEIVEQLNNTNKK